MKLIKREREKERRSEREGEYCKQGLTLPSSTRYLCVDQGSTYSSISLLVYPKYLLLKTSEDVYNNFIISEIMNFYF